MTRVETYLEGWMADDLDTVQNACAEDFVFDDPYDGRITKAQFPMYWEAQAGEGGWTDVVVQDADGVETGWAWWEWTPEGKTAADAQAGSIVIKADADGLHSARTAYYQR